MGLEPRISFIDTPEELEILIVFQKFDLNKLRSADTMKNYSLEDE